MNQQQTIEIEMKEAKEAVAMAESLERLYKNRDFKKVVTECFMRDNVVMNVHALGNPAYKNDENTVKSIHDRIQAVAELVEFFRMVQQHGENARYALKDAEAELATVVEEF